MTVKNCVQIIATVTSRTGCDHAQSAQDVGGHMTLVRLIATYKVIGGINLGNP